jgi:hypothetical protein
LRTTDKPKARQDEKHLNNNTNRWSTMLSLAGVDDIRIMDLNQYLEKMNTTTKFI